MNCCELDKNFGDNREVTEEFLKCLIKGVAIRSANYHINTNGLDNLFVNSEEQIGTAICPTIEGDISSIFKRELPIQRKDEYGKKKDKRGKLDYWIFHRNISFAVEVKLAHMTYTNNDYTNETGIFDTFNEVIEQLNGIEEDTTLFLMPHTNGLIKIGLVILAFKNPQNEIRINNFRLKEIQREIIKKFSLLLKTAESNKRNGLKFNDVINFNAIWLIEHHLASLKDSVRNEYKISPALGFFGHVSNVYLPSQLK